jgi:hypothetical protein
MSFQFTIALWRRSQNAGFEIRMYRVQVPRIQGQPTLSTPRGVD